MPISLASSGGGRRLGVEGEEHRTFLRAGLAREGAGNIHLVDGQQVLEPIFVFDPAGDAYIEAKDKPLTMEAIDVSAGEYEVAYDLSGQQFVLAVDGHPETGSVVLRPTGKYDVEDLERRLRSYLTTAGLEVPQTGDLPIAVANAMSAAEWELRWPKWPRWLAGRLFGERPQRYGRSA